jgi:hypothetical protein
MEITTKREALCADVASGKIVFAKELPAPGAYLPRRELAFANGTLLFAHADGEGLELSAWTVEGGAK